MSGTPRPVTRHPCMAWGAWLSSTRLQMGLESSPPATSFVSQSDVDTRDDLPRLHRTRKWLCGRSPKCQVSKVWETLEFGEGLPLSQARSSCSPALRCAHQPGSQVSLLGRRWPPSESGSQQLFTCTQVCPSAWIAGVTAR